MEGLIFLYFFIAIVALVINIIICTKFADIAADKGYSHSSYFWCCFFLGITGYIMVAALPDLSLYNAIREVDKKTNAPKSNTPAAPSAPRSPNYSVSANVPASWTCTCGRVNASYVSSCFCGKSKREVMSQKES